jgi:hypothetical protein
VTVGVEDAIVVEDMAGGDETLEKVLKANLFAFWEVSSRHVSCV